MMVLRYIHASRVYLSVALVLALALALAGASSSVGAVCLAVADLTCASTCVSIFLDFHILMRSPPGCINTPAWWSVSILKFIRVLRPRNASLSLSSGFCSIGISRGTVFMPSSSPISCVFCTSHNFILISFSPAGVFHFTVGISMSRMEAPLSRKLRTCAVDI